MVTTTMHILDILSQDSIKVPLDATDRKSAIEELVQVLHAAGHVSDPKSLMQSVWEREQQRSTGIGEGLAIPHGKTPTLKNLVMAVGRPKTPIDYDAIDKKPVQLIVLLASPPERTSDHIQALGRISRLMSDAEFRENAYNAENAAALYELFQNAEL